jgi:antitoxin MazE
MRTKLIKIGNSQGVRLSKAIIEQVGLGKDIELEVFEDEIVIRPANRKTREGWAESCKAMAAAGDDVLPDWPQISLTRFDDEEWEW